MELTSEQVTKLFEDLGTIKSDVKTSARNIECLQHDVPIKIKEAVKIHEEELHPVTSAAGRDDKKWKQYAILLSSISAIIAISMFIINILK